jgi:hypothetical protein
LIVCPRASESQATYDLMAAIPPEAPVVIMNPELIDAGVVGFGMGEWMENFEVWVPESSMCGVHWS